MLHARKGHSMKNTTRTLTTMALALSLAVVPLAGCSGSSDQGGDATTEPTEQTEPAAEPAAPVDVDSWKTLGDALASKTADMGSSHDDNHYIAVFEAGDKVIRVVATLDSETARKIDDLDPLAANYEKDLNELIAGLELESAQDITDDELSQAELSALVGKTGQELVDDGFVFVDYAMYGAEDESAANMDKGFFSYCITFDAGVVEDQSEDEGAAIMSAKVTAAERVSVSDSALDPSTL